MIVSHQSSTSHHHCSCWFPEYLSLISISSHTLLAFPDEPYNFAAEYAVWRVDLPFAD
jgi:hypothetical protein